MTVLVELELPKDMQKFRLPAALKKRLNDLLDRQDRTGKLPPQERREATALTELAELLSLVRLRAELAARKRNPGDGLLV